MSDQDEHDWNQSGVRHSNHSKGSTRSRQLAKCHMQKNFTSVSVFLLQETVRTFIKEAGGTTPVHTRTSMEYGTEEAIIEASTKMEFSGLSTEAGHTP